MVEGTQLQVYTKHQSCVQVVEEQTWQYGGRRNGELSAQVMSENEKLCETEWLVASGQRSTMTSGMDVVEHCDGLWMLRVV